MKISFIITATLLAASGGISAVHAQRYLTGELSGSYPSGEYIVTGNIHVLPKAKLSFEPGCLLRFESYTGIVVRGELICRGTAQKPVVFTSSRDVPSARTMPEAFDWIGIKVTSEAAGMTLENCVISYSSFGLNIESNATPVSLKEIKFSNNGSASLTREKKMMAVTDNRGISFVWPEMQAGTPESLLSTESDGAHTTVKTDDKQAAAKKNSVKKAVAPPPAWVKPVRIGTAGTAALGGALWVIGVVQAGHYREILDADERLASNDPEKMKIIERDDIERSFSTWAMVGNTGIGLFGIGAAGFAVTFFF